MILDYDLLNETLLLIIDSSNDCPFSKSNSANSTRPRRRPAVSESHILISVDAIIK